eukprot:scaffold139905_cov175-Phaeocystis_antarctica.AAC.1
MHLRAHRTVGDRLDDFELPLDEHSEVGSRQRVPVERRGRPSGVAHNLRLERRRRAHVEVRVQIRPEAWAALELPTR